MSRRYRALATAQGREIRDKVGLLRLSPFERERGMVKRPPRTRVARRGPGATPLSSCAVSTNQ